MKRPNPPKKPQNAYMKHLKHILDKKIGSIKRKPLRKIKGYAYKFHWKQHTPQKYVKNYWKNFTQPIRTPYLKAKKVYKRANKVIKTFKTASKLFNQQITAKQKYESRLARYNNQLERYNKWRDNKIARLNKQRERLEKDFKKAVRTNKLKDVYNRETWKELVNRYKGSKVSPPKSVPLDIYKEWKLEKQRELRLKWNKLQLNYIPRMDENGYLAMLISPETIHKYYNEEAQSIFPTVEVFRDFLKDYFGYGGIVAFGAGGTIESTGAGGMVQFFRILLKLVAKFVV